MWTNQTSRLHINQSKGKDGRWKMIYIIYRITNQLWGICDFCQMIPDISQIQICAQSVQAQHCWTGRSAEHVKRAQLTQREGDVITHAQQLAETHRASILVYPQLLHPAGQTHNSYIINGKSKKPLAQAPHQQLQHKTEDLEKCSTTLALHSLDEIVRQLLIKAFNLALSNFHFQLT